MSVCVSILIGIDGPFPDQPEFEWLVGIMLLCSGLIFIAIPVIVGIFALRRKKNNPPSISPNEPIPPAN
jgi:hypothetical protein